VPEDAVEREARARTFWSGTITFGLVSIPVALMPANRTERVSLRMVTPEGTPLSRRYFAPEEGKPLEADEIVRGYEVEKGRFVVVDDDELERLAPERTRDIDLRVFVKAEEIDPMHFERAYFLTPAGGSTKAYRLLARVMEETGRAGIASFVMRGKEYLIAILAENGILRAETLRFADEVRTPAEVGLPEPAKPDPAAVKEIAAEIAKRAEKTLDPAELEDRSGERLRALAERKRAAGEDVHRPDTAAAREEETGVIDLMEVLKRRLEVSDDGDERPAPRRSGGGAKQAAADALEELSKSELYERAKKQDIPGRSGMSRDELLRALRGA
jgi:DNA end-binding protein Ku